MIDAYTTTQSLPVRAVRRHQPAAKTAAGSSPTSTTCATRSRSPIDAFNGDLTFYRVDKEDPIARAYDKAFPKLFTDGDKMSDDLRAHLRYPEDLFRVQTTMFGRYHLTNPDDVLQRVRRVECGAGSRHGRDSTTAGATNTTSLATPGARVSDERMEPYYVLTRLPSDKEAEFQILQPFVPRSASDSRRNLTAFMVAKSDPGSYGKLEAYVMPDGPASGGAGADRLGDAIGSGGRIDGVVAVVVGSKIKRGNIVMLPIANSIIAVRPMYVQAEGPNSFPQLRKVIVWHAGRVRMGDTLEEALRALFGDAPPDAGAGPDQARRLAQPDRRPARRYRPAGQG